MANSKIILSGGVTELANVKSVIFREAVNGGGDLRPGCVGSASVEIEVYNTQPNAVEAGDALFYYQIDTDDTETLIGVFYAEPVIATKNSYKIVAYDAANKLDADFSAWLMANQSNFPMTIYALVSAACTVAGVTLGSASWPLSTENVQAFYADGLTCRDILSYAAELGCRFVRCHADGNVYFDWYATATNKRIYPSAGTSGAETRYAYKQDGLSYANYTTAALDGVAVHPSGEDDVAYIYPVSASGNLLNIGNNLLLTGADSSLYNAAAQAIYTGISAIGQYRPATARLFPKENPFRAGDIVAVTDAQGVSFTTVVMEQTVNNSDAILSSTGNEDYSDAHGNTQRAITQLASDVVRINKLKVDWADINTAIINYLEANNVTAQNLTIIDENGNVLATYTANGITLGQSDEAHAEIDFNSLHLKDKDGDVYFSVGDERDVNGEVFVTVNYIGDGGNIFYLQPKATDENSIVVTVDGVVVTNYMVDVVGSATRIVIPAAPGVGQTITFTYTTTEPFYYYTLGQREIGSDIGSFSFAAGRFSEANSYASTVCGGLENKAYGIGAIVGGGARNKASGEYSVIGGGRDNEATGEMAFIGAGIRNQAQKDESAVCAGADNQANGDSSAVLCGKQNVAQGLRSGVGNGDTNDASGENSFALGEKSKANGKDSFVFGRYNVEDTSDAFAEIVGNGTGNNNRSNARTLDWNGNETLAGGLMLGTPLGPGSGGTGVTTYAALLSELGLGGLYFKYITVAANTTGQFSVGNGKRGFVLCCGAGADAKAMALFNTSSAGGASFNNISTASASLISFTNAGGGIINVVNGSNSACRALIFYVA